MATKKKNLRGVGSPDFTYNEPLRIIVRFNSENVVALAIDRENLAITGKVMDEVNEKSFTIAGTLTEDA